MTLDTFFMVYLMIRNATEESGRHDESMAMHLGKGGAAVHLHRYVSIDQYLRSLLLSKKETVLPCRLGFMEWPWGRGNPSTLSENRTTKFSFAMSASGTATIAFMTASATSFLTLAVLQAFGSQVMCTKGILSEGGELDMLSIFLRCEMIATSLWIRCTSVRLARQSSPACFLRVR